MVPAQRVIDLATEHGFGDIAADVAALARPALRLTYADRPPAPGGTKLGGLPDLPADVGWPHAPWPGYEHEAMTFFGQIALAELDAAIWTGPREGLLSFFCRQSPDFYGVDVAGAAEVLLVPDGAELHQADPPAGLFEEFLLDERPVVPEPELVLPTISVDIALALMPLGFGFDDAPRAGQLEAYRALVEALAAEQNHGMSPEGGRPADHRLLGWPRHVQGDVLPEIAGMHTEVDGRSADDLLARAAAWELLLQVQADHRLGVSFGDGGTLFFGLPVGDLPAGRFDRVQAISQSG